jgi:hypothetical protein
MEFRNPINLGSANEATKQLLSDNGGCAQVTTSQYIIDGHQGYLTRYCKYSKALWGFIPQYLLDSTKGSGSIECLIASTYPRDNGSSELLKTIHIEKQAG